MQALELRVDTDCFYESSEGQSPKGRCYTEPSESICCRTNDRPKSVDDPLMLNGDVEVPVLRTSLPRSFSAPYPPLEGIAEEAWQWDAWQEYQVSEEEYQRAVRVEGYILSLVQRYTLKSRHCWPRTTLTPDPQYYTSLRKRTPSFSSKQRFPDPHLLPHVDLSQSQGWGCDLLQGEEAPSLEEDCYLALPYPQSRPLSLAERLPSPLPSLDPNCGVGPRDPYCEPPSPQHHYSHPHKHSSVGPQFIPGQAGQVSPRHSEQHSKGRTSKKSHNERPKPKKSSSKTSRSQSENSLLGQRLLPERRYSTTERHQGKTDQNTRVPGPQGGVGNESRRWCSNLELSQDEGEEAAAGIRRALRKARHCSHSQQQDFQQRAPLCRGEEGYNGPAESESSMSEVYSPASSSLSSDSDDFGGLVWPQELPPRLASSSSSSSPSPKTTATANVNVQPKAFVKIKASHALKKKILRFRSGSLKVMTTV
ncbi:Dapper 1-B [Dissostichus eleginoides]|uniref:Dapper 1-B n=2 Tax=Dissostichus eleginoides TaxID=100907 RepID=A0AAD9CCW3_DISEL|nr:Dapper 1-B [Dissostichus eleginoides]